MPRWTLTNYCSRITAGLVNRQEISLSVASFWVNEAQKVVWDVLPLDAKERLAVSSSTSGENRITLPTDYDELLSLSNTSANAPDPLHPVNRNQADSWTTITGTPTHYMLYSDWLELYPTPDSAYSIQLRYRAQPSDMTLATAVSSCGTRWDQAIFHKAKELICTELRDFETAQIAAGQFRSYIASLPSDREKRLRNDRMLGMSVPREYNGYPNRPVTEDFDNSDG